MQHDILQTVNDDLCDVALKFLSTVIKIQKNSLNSSHKAKYIDFWKSLISSGLKTVLDVISSDMMISTYKKSNKSVEQFYLELNCLKK